MARDIKKYILIVVLPAIMLVAGGIRLVSLERSRALEAVQSQLNEAARTAAKQIRAKVSLARRAGGRPEAADFPPPKHGPPPRLGRWWKPHRESECCIHELPEEELKTISACIAEFEKGDESGKIVELRHICGCTVIAPSGTITGRIYGQAPLDPVLGGYMVCVAPAGGDEAVALGMRAQAMLAAILLLLLLSTMAAGVILLVRSEKAAREESLRKTNFISNISHELKTPLTGISLFSEMIAGGSLKGDAVAQAGATINKETRRLAKLIDALLEYARLERGTRKYDIEDFSINGVIEEAAAAFGPAFKNGLKTAPCSGDPLVRADREAVRRIIDALLENALKYAGGSEVVLGAEACGNGAVEVRVADRGPGISREDSAHVFERFWRADNSVTRSTGGTGLGLAIAKELARGTGGDLRLGANTPGGCVFTLVLEAANG